MKKLLITLIILIFMFSLVGCGHETIVLNIDNTEEMHNNIAGRNALINIGSGLYYDSTTRIVYWWNGSFTANYATTPTAYYAPNGLPYKYNPETSTLEEIQIGE